MIINPLALRALPLYFAAQNTGGEVETYSLFVSVPILYAKPRNATGHGRGGGQTRTIPVNYRQNRFGGVEFLVFKIKKAVNRKINSLMQYPKGDLNPHSCNSQRILSPSCLPFHHSGSLRAKNGTRTRDPNLGKVVLYQLSYFRNCECKDKMLFCFCKITARKSNGKFCLRLYRPMEGNYVRDYKLTYFTAYSSTNIERLLFVSIMPFHGNHKYRYNILVNLVNKP